MNGVFRLLGGKPFITLKDNMKLICSVCEKEFDGRSDAKYCSNLCKMVAKRVKNDTDNIEDDTDNLLAVSKEDLNVTEPVTDTPVTTQINAPKHGPKTDYYSSETYKKIIHDLDTMSVKELEEKGIFVPCWKYSLAKRPFKTVFD